MAFRDLYGPWALVTGASSGLGAVFARQLAGRGLDLIITARRTERLRTVAEECRREGATQIRIVTADLATRRGQNAVVDEVREVDCGLLVHNAGFGYSGPFLEQPIDRLEQMLRLNVEAPTKLCRRLLPEMAARGRGGVIFVSSTAAYQPTPWMAAYGASKVFDLHFGEALAVELGSAGLDVLCVSPGHTATEFHAVAGVDHAATGGSPADPEDVVAQALDRLGHELSFVHGGRNKLLSFVHRFLPRTLSTWAAGRVLHRRL